MKEYMSLMRRRELLLSRLDYDGSYKLTPKKEASTREEIAKIETTIAWMTGNSSVINTGKGERK